MELISNVQVERLQVCTGPICPNNSYSDLLPYPIKNLSIVLRYLEGNAHTKFVPFFSVRFDSRHNSAIGIKKTSDVCSLNFSALLSHGASSHVVDIQSIPPGTSETGDRGT